MRLGILYSSLALLLGILCGCPSLPPARFPANDAFRQAESNFLAGNYLEAIGCYRQFIASEKNSEYIPEAHYRSGISYLALGNYREAEKNLLTALKNPPRTNRQSFKTLAYNALAQLYQEQYKYKEAVYYYRQTINSNDRELSEPYLNYNLGLCLMRNGRHAEGRQHIQSAMKMLKPENKEDEKLRERIQERLSIPPDIFTVQLGKFSVKENAVNYQKILLQEKGINTAVTIILIAGSEFYYVWSGRYDSFKEARKEAERINETGTEAVVIP
jgi:tetratricopeptide (TPR) repeat protein